MTLEGGGGGTVPALELEPEPEPELPLPEPALELALPPDGVIGWMISLSGKRARLLTSHLPYC